MADSPSRPAGAHRGSPRRAMSATPGRVPPRPTMRSSLRVRPPPRARESPSKCSAHRRRSTRDSWHSSGDAAVRIDDCLGLRFPHGRCDDGLESWRWFRAAKIAFNRDIVKMVSSPILVHETSPPCSAATVLAKARPNPTPSGFVVTKGSNKVLRMLSGGPFPESAICTRTYRSARSTHSRTRPPLPAASTAFRTTFKSPARTFCELSTRQSRSGGIGSHVQPT